MTEVHFEPQTTPGSTEELRTKAAFAREAVADLASEARHYATQRVKTMATSTGGKLREYNDQVVDFVQRHPYQSIGIAAGIGFVAGLILKRR